MKYLVITMLSIMQLTYLFADDYFISSAKERKYRIGYYHDFNGNLIKIENLKLIITRNNPIISEFRFYRLDEKVFTSKDLRSWHQILDYADVENKYFKNVLLISPNPVNDILMLNGFEGEKFEIYSVYGIKVLEGVTKIQVDVSSLNSGFYLLKIGMLTTKFIKL
mgnify:CR=1 FL=1